MGFNKRYITKESVLEAYETDKILGIKKLFKADALIFTGDHQEECSEIHKCILDYNEKSALEIIKKLQ